MANDCVKASENIYFRCRKDAAKYDDRLSSREGASELLGVSVSSLSDYELGNTKVVPVDKVDLMAKLYRAPQLRTTYCKNECPIGKHLNLATELKSIEAIALRLLAMLEESRIGDIKKQILAVAYNGKIDRFDVPILYEVKEQLAELQLVMSELMLLCDKEGVSRENR